MDKKERVEKARKAKKVLFALLKNKSWLTGVGIGKKGDEFCIRVNVLQRNDDVLRCVPSEVNGVPVEIVETGVITPRKK